MSWKYNNEDLTDDMIPDKAVGFIYLITHIPSNKKYIGRKLLTKAHRRQKNNKIIRTRIDSGWKDYWSSSPEVNLLVETEGYDSFTREVILFASSKGQMNYMEECLQFVFGVVESEMWFNGNIRSKLYKRNLYNKPDIISMRNFINSHISKTNPQSLYNLD